MSTLSTCGRCGGTIERRPGSVAGWGHVTETPRNADGHQPVPDDSAVSGPGRDDLPRCPACHHPEHMRDEDELCEERVGTGLFGSDGVEVTRWCPCTGPALPVHQPGCPELYEVTPGRDACTCPRPRPDEVSAVSPDPWMDPDAAAALNPPPF